MCLSLKMPDQLQEEAVDPLRPLTGGDVLVQQDAQLTVHAEGGGDVRIFYLEFSPLAGPGQEPDYHWLELCADFQGELVVKFCIALLVAELLGVAVVQLYLREGGHALDELRKGQVQVGDSQEPVHLALGVLVKGRVEELLLGGEIPVAESLGHMHFPGDVRDGCLFIPLLIEHLHGSVDDLLPALLGVFRDPRHGHPFFPYLWITIPQGNRFVNEYCSFTKREV